MWVSLALALAAQTQDADPLHRVVAVDVGPDALAQVEYAADFTGALYVWVESGDLDPFVTIESAQGERLEDDDSGGGTTAFVALQVERDDRLWISIGRESDAAIGSCELHFVGAPETEATRAAAERAEEQLREIERLRTAGDLDGARALVARTVDALDASEGVATSAQAALAFERLARVAFELGALHACASARDRQLQHRERTLPPRDLRLHVTRVDLAVVLRDLGRLEEARELAEPAVAVLAESLPENDRTLNWAWTTLSGVSKKLGDLPGALRIDERVHEVMVRSFPDEHPDVQNARQSLAGTLYSLGRLHEADALFSKVLEVRSRTLADDHPELQVARLNAAVVRKALGDYRGAREPLERAVEALAKRLGANHPSVLMARTNLANALQEIGDLGTARSIHEQLLAEASSRLSDDHLDVAIARANLAVTLKGLGDFEAARELEERVLEVRVRALSPDHPALAKARGNLAATVARLGDLEKSRDLWQSALAAYEARGDHPDLPWARRGLGETLMRSGEYEAARTLIEAAFEAATNEFPGDHRDVLSARASLARVLFLLGESDAAHLRMEEVLADSAQSRPDDDWFVIAARSNLAISCVARGEHGRAVGLARDLVRGLRGAIAAAFAGSAAREIEERVASLEQAMETALRIAFDHPDADPSGDLGSEAFALLESSRAAAVVLGAAARAAAHDPEVERLRSEQRTAAADLVRLVQEGGADEDIASARHRAEALERERRAHVATLPVAGALLTEPTVHALRARLGPHDALVAFHRTPKVLFDPRPTQSKFGFEVILAFVLQREGRLSCVDLGDAEAIAAAADDWRRAVVAGVDRSAEGLAEVDAGLRGVGVGSAPGGDEGKLGERLRELVFDPLLPHVGDAKRLVVALDDALHVVPLDALPLGDGLVGDRYRIELHSTFRELLWPRSAADASGGLVALGGATYDGAPESLLSDDAIAKSDAPPDLGGGSGGILRGGAWSRGFDPLPNTDAESREIARLHEAAFENSQPTLVLSGRRASRDALEAFAPHARWLHVATHGWFAPDSIASIADAPLIDPGSDLTALPREDRVRGLSPMLLCGIALAGANLPVDAVGSVPGLITAEEIAALDLSGCELAVLSACDTNVGVRRAGQGVASLQRALHVAGARSVITSLWRVPDEATRELMVDFYRRLWVERKPMAQALWEAKSKLREAVDDEGRPRHATRDWAAWVLTGAQD